MKTPNKYDPQTCNRSGEANRRLKAIERRKENYYQSVEKQRKLYYVNPHLEDIPF